MLGLKFLLLATAAVVTAADAALPVFFFHGATGNHTNGDNIGQQLTAAGHKYVPLDFCERACSVETALNDQVQLAIKQIRGIIAKSPATYSNGYHLLAHSQGGVIARGVAEEMDDHAIHSLVALAGDGYGNFYGPQASDLGSPLQVLLQALGPFVMPETVFNFTKYQVDPTTYHGKFQLDFTKFVLSHPELQKNNTVLNSWFPPVRNSATNFLTVNPFYPEINNLQVCGTDTTCTKNQQRRKANFLRLKALHLFASPGDDIQSPWQTSLLTKYSELASVDDIETQFSTLKVLDTRETEEYKSDLFGLQSLDKTGRLFLHVVPDIGHNCWLFDYVPLGQTKECKFEPNYLANVAPVFVDGAK